MVASPLENLFEFVQFTHKFQQVKRRIYVTGEDRDENDAEHSFQLALLAWYLIDHKKLKLKKTKVLKYALVHDLVETYAGDTYFYTTDQNLKNSKAQREKKAIEKIKQDFSQFRELNKMIQDYEAKSDPEARFVYALDKILPAINVFLDQGRSWQRDHVTYEMLRTKDEKVIASKDIQEIWEIFIEIIDRNKHFFSI